VMLAAGLALAADPGWFQGDRPHPQVGAGLELLAAAESQGLDPRDYRAAELQQAVRQAGAGAPLEPMARERLQQALNEAFMRYLSDLRDGRIDPSEVRARFEKPRRPPLDSAAVLADALAQQRLPQALGEAEPRLPMYAALRDALAHFRALETHPAWQQVLPELPGRKLEPGHAYQGLALLAGRLQALGDLPAGAAVPQRYEGALVDAVRGFQERHGLDVDGVLGAATFGELAVTPAARARQIAIAMERLRWTPFLQGPRMIVVNVPEFMLRAYEVEDGRVRVRQAMKVIVGRALDTRTPLFDGTMQFIEFSPYWNVPPSIARGEVVPRLRRDPGYFDRQGFEFVAPGGRVVTTLAPSHLDDVLSGKWRIRQRPGPLNALGDIKFVFPNSSNIYLHHTPSVGLFGRERRDLSHGCIRVEEPVALARFVLANDPAWPEQRIRDAMGAGVSRTIELREPLPVLIAYSTVVAKAGRMFFYRDLYGHDRLLAQALQRRSDALAARAAPVRN
jgi:L,D-transpeptidase YcbB